MIRSWLRRRRPPADLVDAAVVVTAQIDVRDGQIEGLRDALAEARQQLEYERQVAAVLAGQLAAYKAREYMAAAARARRRLAEDTTLRTSVAELHRARPMDAPTEQYRRPR